MKCLIVAAGQGSRLHGHPEPKPLVPLRGTPLIGHVIERARAGGADGFVVVSGYRGAELRAWLDAEPVAAGIGIVHVVNDAWDRANGLSVLAAEAALDGPFLLSMCDHVVDPGIFRALRGSDLARDDVVLAVDRDLASPLVDPDDVTRVETEGDRIVRIGKRLARWDCHDTGVFRCAPVLFDALRESAAAGDDSISGAMNALARRGRARVLDIGARPWIDVDDDAALARAETLLDRGRL